TNVIAREIARRENRATVYLIGTDGLRDDLHRHGLRVIENPEEIDYLADFVVVGDDPELTALKLTRALRSLRQGARLAVADETAVIDRGEEAWAGPGATVAAICAMTGRDPDLVLGRPRDHITLSAQKSASLPPEEWATVTSPSDDPTGDLLEGRGPAGHQ